MDVPLPLRELIGRGGPLRFDRFVDWSLYEADHGFFAAGGGAGRRSGDFITSPEVGPLFGAVVARWLDQVWIDLGRPAPFRVVEVGAGRGALAVGLRAAAPACAAALDLRLVERSDALRAAQGEHLPLAGAPGPGAVTAHAEAPTDSFSGVVLANELLDNLAFRLLERTQSGWAEVCVGLDEAGAAIEVLAPADPAVAGRCERLAPAAEVGARLPLQDAASTWVTEVLDRLVAGRLLVFDYAASSAELAGRPRHEWLRTYRGHQRGGDPLESPGSQDITVEVALDQLPAGARDTSQSEWLVANGIDELVTAARQVWRERAAVGDLAALRARSAVVEAEALCDPSGLGAFRVLQWRAPAGEVVG